MEVKTIGYERRENEKVEGERRKFGLVVRHCISYRTYISVRINVLAHSLVRRLKWEI